MGVTSCLPQNSVTQPNPSSTQTHVSSPLLLHLLLKLKTFLLTASTLYGKQRRVSLLQESLRLMLMGRSSRRVTRTEIFMTPLQQIFLSLDFTGQLIQYRDWATGWTTGVQFPEWVMMVLFLRATASHQASYTLCTGGSCLRGKAAGAWSWLFASIECQG
jgi:hypothetical protein